jgi:hypothetical protein
MHGREVPLEEEAAIRLQQEIVGKSLDHEYSATCAMPTRCQL